jgi:hypothetical protein
MHIRAWEGRQSIPLQGMIGHCQATSASQLAWTWSTLVEPPGLSPLEHWQQRLTVMREQWASNCGVAAHHHALQHQEVGEQPPLSLSLGVQLLRKTEKLFLIVLWHCRIRLCALHIQSLAPVPLIQPIDAIHKLNNCECIVNCLFNALLLAICLCPHACKVSCEWQSFLEISLWSHWLPSH